MRSKDLLDAMLRMRQIRMMRLHETYELRRIRDIVLRSDAQGRLTVTVRLEDRCGHCIMEARPDALEPIDDGLPGDLYREAQRASLEDQLAALRAEMLRRRPVRCWGVRYERISGILVCCDTLGYAKIWAEVEELDGRIIPADPARLEIVDEDEPGIGAKLLEVGARLLDKRDQAAETAL